MGVMTMATEQPSARAVALVEGLMGKARMLQQAVEHPLLLFRRTEQCRRTLDAARADLLAYIATLEHALAWYADPATYEVPPIVFVARPGGWQSQHPLSAIARD